MSWNLWGVCSAPIAVLAVHRSLHSDSAGTRLRAAHKERTVPLRAALEGTPLRRNSWQPGRQRSSTSMRRRLSSISTPSTRRVTMALTTAVIASLLVPFPLALGLGTALFVGDRKRGAWRRARELQRLDSDVVAFVEDLARNLRGGVSTSEALATVARGFAKHHFFVELATLCQRSRGVTPALERWATLAPSPDTRRLAQLLLVGESLGGLRPQFVDGIARTFREAAQLTSEIRVLSDQARYSAIMMSIAPVAFAVLLVGTDARAKHFLLETTLGGALIVVGLVLDVAGLAWMRRLVARVAVS